MTKTVNKPVLVFHKEAYHRNGEYCVVGAIAKAYGCFPKVELSHSENIMCADVAYGIIKDMIDCVKDKTGITWNELASLQDRNDNSDWIEVSKILRDKGVFDKVAPFAVNTVDEDELRLAESNI